MAKEIRLPQLGQTMEEGTIISCMVKIGDEVKKGDCVFEIETDKATLEMESPADGFVKHILAELDETLPVGAPMLVLGNKDEEVSQSFLDSLKAAAEAPPAVPSAGAEPAKPKLQPTKTVAKPTASPRVKKLAKAAGAEAKLGATIPVNRLQKLIAERMLKSKREIPCFYLTVKADVTDLVESRAKLNETSDVKISYNDFIIRAVATGVEKFPIMSGQLAGDAIKLADTINIGLAVSAPKGLVAPVVKDAHKKDVKQIAADTKALIEKAQNEKLLLTDLEGACITVSNLGGFGIESFIPIVIPGQCSILGVGRITDACVPDNDSFAVRKLMSLTLSVDHKVADGAYASQFLDLVRKLLEDTSTFE